jgi:hypothetical protein
MQNYTRATKLVVLLLTATLPLGCAHKTPLPPTPVSPLVGIWQGKALTPHGTTVQSTFSFTPDGRETMALQLHTNGHTLSIGSTGTYTATSTQLTQTITEATMNGKAIALSPHAPRTETDQYTLHGDTLIVTKPGSPSPFVMTRQRSVS